MTTNVNRVQLRGNLGAAPEVKNLESSKKVANFSMAVNESYKNAQGETIVNTQWFNIVSWGKLAGIVETYLTKGDEVSVEGKLSTRSYEDKEGVKRYITEIVADDVIFVAKIDKDKAKEADVEGENA